MSVWYRPASAAVTGGSGELMEVKGALLLHDGAEGRLQRCCCPQSCLALGTVPSASLTGHVLPQSSLSHKPPL